MKKRKIFISRKPHRSIPANPLLAEPMYLAGYIERMGTGTGDIIRLCDEAGLNEPEFIQEEDFKTIIWRTLKTTVEVTGEPSEEPTGQAENLDNEEVSEVVTGQATGQATRQAEGIDFEEVNEDATLQATLQATPQAAEEVLETVKRVVLVLEGDLKRAEIQELLGLRDRVNFVSNYLEPSLVSSHIEMTIPEIPTHQEQRYRLTAKGIALKKKLHKSKKKK